MEHSRYFELWKDKLVLAVRGVGGRVLAGEVNKEGLYKVGGTDSLRGYKPGATDSLVGETMLVVNAELRFPIVERITGVVFADWGRAWDRGEPREST